MKFILFLVALLIFGGCGYSPSSKFARGVVGEKISTSIRVSQVDPQNSVLIKDAIDSAVVEMFKASLSSKEDATTHLSIAPSNPSYSPTTYDANGYVIGYRTTLSLSITKTTKDRPTKTYSTRGFYDFAIEPQSIITDQQRFVSINMAAQKAIQAFISKVSADGARNEKNGVLDDNSSDNQTSN